MLVRLSSRLVQRLRVDFRSLLLAVIISRLAFLLVRVFLLAGTDGPNDWQYFMKLARMADQGLYPYLDFWVEYPPVYVWLVTAVYHLGTLVATGVAAEFIFYAALGLVLVAAEAGLVILLYRVATVLHNRATAHRSALLYVLICVPAYIWTGWFDVLPACLLLAGLYWLLSGHEKASAFVVGLGVVSKFFPVLLFPLALCALPGVRRKVTYTLVTGITVSAVLLPALLASPTLLWASLRNPFNRPAWETVWALLDGYYGYGIVAPLSWHMDSTTASWLDHPTFLPWPLITAFFGLLFLLFYRRVYGLLHNPTQIVAAVAFSLHLLLLYSRGYSPQYLIWIAPFLLILYPNRQGALYMGALAALNLLELPVYINFLSGQHWLLVLTVVGRTVLLTTLAWDFLAIALQQRVPALLVPQAQSSRQHGW